MRPAEEIENNLKNMSLKASAELRKKILDDALKAHQQSKTQPAFDKPNIWRIIMNSKTSKLAAAAVIAIVAFATWRISETNNHISSIELLQKIQATEGKLYAGDKIVHIVNEITVYKSQYNPKTQEMIQKMNDQKMSADELDKMNRELISSWLVSWLPMCSLQPSGEMRITEIRLAKDANEAHTITDSAWYDPKTRKFVRTMETGDKVIFANSYDGEFVNITETAADGMVQLKSEAIGSTFKAPENPAEFLGITAGVRQCMNDKCFSQPVQDVTKGTLADGTAVVIYKVGFPNPWGDLNTYYLFKINQADEIIAEIEYIYAGSTQMLIRRVLNEQVDKAEYSWNLAELNSKELANEAPSGVTVASDVAIPNVSIRHMVDTAKFETYIFATDPNWTKGRMIIDIVDTLNPAERMFVAIYQPKDNDTRLTLIIQSETHNKYMGALFKQHEAQGAKVNWKEYANGCKVFRHAESEAFWTELSFKNCQVEPSKDRTGLIVEMPSGTYCLIAVNGAVTDEEIAEMVNSLIPAKDYQVK